MMDPGTYSTDVLDALEDGLALWDRDDRFVLCNARYREILHAATCHLAVGVGWPALVDACNARHVFAVPLSSDLIGESSGDGLDHELADGSWVRMTERPSGDGGTLRLIRDITREKARERDLRLWWEYLEGQTRDLDGLTSALSEAKVAAEAANQAKSAFLAGMSHELRTPLNAVLGFAEIIRDQVFGRHEIDRYSTYAADIHASGLHLLILIEDILDLSKIEAGKMALREDIVDLESIVASAYNLVAEAAARGQVTLRRLARERIALRADGMKLKQCLLNLLSNAIKFTPPGGSVTFSVNIDAEHLSLRVQDTGIGMAPDDIPKVLEPFLQLDAALHSNKHGTGLGMPLTKRFIELHGGSLMLDSEPGRGTLVELRLPVARVMAQEGWDQEGALA